MYVDEVPPTWRQEDDEMGSEISPRPSKSDELINRLLRVQMGRRKGFHSDYIKENNVNFLSPWNEGISKSVNEQTNFTAGLGHQQPRGARNKALY